MGEIRLFHQVYGQVFPLESNLFLDEERLRKQIERNLMVYLGVHFLAHEREIGASELGSDEKGRIDTLGIDAKGRPVIVVYKRDKDKNVVQQALDYRDWLSKNQAMFELLVMKSKEDVPTRIVWPPRIVIIAGGFEPVNFRQAKREDDKRKDVIELVRYLQFGPDMNMLMLERVFPERLVSRSVPSRPKSIPDTDSQLSEWNPVKAREELCKFITTTLGPDVKVAKRETYTRFDRHHRGPFASVRPHPVKGEIVAHAKLDPKRQRLEDGFTRDVSGKGKHGIGDLEIRIGNSDDFERAKPLFRKAYERN